MNAEDKKKDESGRKMDSRSTAQTLHNPQVFDMIGRRLKDYYETVASQPVPDRFLDLLKQLDKKGPPDTGK